MIGLDDSALDQGDALGAATVDAAVNFDRVAFQLLGACALGDPEADRLARVRGALAMWREADQAMRELARVAGVLAGDQVPANDHGSHRRQVVLQAA